MALPLRVVLDPVAAPSEVQGWTVFGLLPGEEVVSRETVLKLSAGRIMLGNGQSFQVSSSAVSVNLD